MIGGGSFYEYETMQSFAKQKKINVLIITIQIIYGCDKIYRAEEFIAELEKKQNDNTGLSP